MNIVLRATSMPPTAVVLSAYRSQPRRAQHWGTVQPHGPVTLHSPVRHVVHHNTQHAHGPLFMNAHRASTSWQPHALYSAQCLGKGVLSLLSFVQSLDARTRAPPPSWFRCSALSDLLALGASFPRGHFKHLACSRHHEPLLLATVHPLVPAAIHLTPPHRSHQPADGVVRDRAHGSPTPFLTRWPISRSLITTNFRCFCSPS